jgi:hypothetical protein
VTKDEVEPLRLCATRAVQAAVQAGKLPKINKETKCADCGGSATQYDHRDYYKKLEVDPVCRSCNFKRGPAHPVPTDWYAYGGRKWNSLNDGEGIEWTFTGQISIDIDIREIEMEIEKARKIRDPDERLATMMLAKMKPKYRDGSAYAKASYRPYKWAGHHLKAFHPDFLENRVAA